jgi:4-amino-4-deoxy-L-arabinose transferase-like glycosyltransferase
MQNELGLRIRVWFDGQHDRQLVTIGLIIALGVRLAAVVVLPPDYLYNAEGDSLLYDALAKNLLDTGAFGPVAGVPDVRVPPVYPFFLASLYALFGRVVMPVRLVQALLGTLTCWLAYLLARTIFSDRRVVWLSFGVVILHPVLIVWPTFRLTETVYIALITATVLVLVKAFRSLTAGLSLAAGSLLGVTLLTRELLFGYPFFVWPLLVIWRKPWQMVWRHILFFTLGLVLVLTPWVIRNASAVGRFVIISDRTEHLRYLVGLAPEEPPRYQNFQQPTRRIGDPRYALPSYMLNPNNVLREPGEYLSTVWAKFKFLWLHPNGLESVPGSALKILYRIGHGLMLALALVGVVIAMRQRNWLAWALILLLGYGTLLHIFASTAIPRYSIPYLPYVFVFFSVGLVSLFDIRRHLERV